MPVLTPAKSEVLTSQERWRRWEQRGVDNESRFRQRLYRYVWTPAMLAIVLLLFWLLR